MPCSVSGSCSGCTSAKAGRRATYSCTLGLYFMVQVPIMSTVTSKPMTICESRKKCRSTRCCGSCGQRRQRGPPHALGQRGGDIADRIGDGLVHLGRQQAAPAVARDFVDQGLVPVRGVEAASHAVCHRTASPSAETSLSISAAPCSSVTQ